MKRLRLLTGGAAIALTTSLAACGASAPQAADNQSNENVVVAVGALPDSLTPSPWGGSASHVVLSGLGSQLLEYKSGPSDGQTCPEPSTEISGRLAESIKPSEDGTGVVVELRKLTSQFGNTLSAEDIRWSFDIGMQRQPVMKGTLKSSGFDVDDLVKVIDEQTIQLNTTDLTSYTEESLQNNLFYIHDSTEAKKHVTSDDPTANEWLSKNLADYSGWQLEAFSPGASLTVTADPNWEGERGSVKRVSVKAVQNTSTRSQLVESGEVQVANGFEYDQYKSLEKAPGVNVLNCDSQTRDTMMINTTTGPLADPKVRHAVSMAIDRDALVKGAYSGFGEAAGSIFPTVEGSSIYKYNQREAKKLLAEAGYAKGFPMTLSYSVTRPGPVAAKSAVLIQSMLKEVGIDVELQNVASSTDFSTALLEGRYQAVLYSEPIVIADPAFYSYAFYGTGAPSNTTGWSNPEFDKARSELAATPDQETEKRTALLENMATLVDGGAPILSLVEVKGVLVAKDGLSGAVPLTNGQIHFNSLGR